ncbi:hypothetical protein K504DRAFT_508189 [Pleomassaria siparia CBS 279.74]|uniref:Uncharacterized protein n=1 Tax=Pleomassaria siparia CBS 279.74 TaxID=1314801 RepID=A0A6G1JSI1_9PLEO|nr:hypothetical protein K504DRAFT_508189 [Pleomassaria siparia CBS 279.74]
MAPFVRSMAQPASASTIAALENCWGEKRAGANSVPKRETNGNCGTSDTPSNGFAYEAATPMSMDTEFSSPSDSASVNSQQNGMLVKRKEPARIFTDSDDDNFDLPVTPSYQGTKELRPKQIEGDVIAKDDRIKTLEAETAAKDARVKELEDMVEKKNLHIDVVVALVGEKSRRSDQLQAEVAQKAAYIEKLEAKITVLESQVVDPIAEDTLTEEAHITDILTADKSNLAETAARNTDSEHITPDDANDAISEDPTPEVSIPEKVNTKTATPAESTPEQSTPEKANTKIAPSEDSTPEQLTPQKTNTETPPPAESAKPLQLQPAAPTKPHAKDEQSPAPHDLTAPVFITPATMKIGTPVPPRPVLKFPNKNIGKQNSSKITTIAAPKPIIAAPKLATLDPEASNNKSTSGNGKGPWKSATGRVLDVRSLSREQREELGRGPKVSLEVRGVYIRGIPKGMFMQVSERAHDLFTKNPHMDVARFPESGMAPAAVKEIAAWITDICSAPKEFSLKIRFAGNTADADAQNLAIMNAARNLGMSAYIRHFTRHYCEDIRKGITTMKLIALIERTATVDDPVFECLVNNLTLHRTMQNDADRQQFEEFLKDHKRLGEAMAKVDMKIKEKHRDTGGKTGSAPTFTDASSAPSYPAGRSGKANTPSLR